MTKSFAKGTDVPVVAEVVVPLLEKKAFGSSFAKALEGRK